MSLSLNKPKLDNFANDHRYQPRTPADELPAEFWRLEKEAETLLKGLSQ